MHRWGLQPAPQHGLVSSSFFFFSHLAYTILASSTGNLAAIALFGETEHVETGTRGSVFQGGNHLRSPTVGDPIHMCGVEASRSTSPSKGTLAFLPGVGKGKPAAAF